MFDQKKLRHKFTHSHAQYAKCVSLRRMAASRMLDTTILDIFMAEDIVWPKSINNSLGTKKDVRRNGRTTKKKQ